MSISPGTSPPELLIGCRLEDGTHTANQLSRQVQRGTLLRLRRGIYFPALAWLTAHPSQRHQWAAAATAAQLGAPVLCRETALHLHGLPLLTIPEAVHVRVGRRSSARVASQPVMHGNRSAADFVSAAQQQVGLAVDVTKASLKGFSTHYVSPTAIESPAEPQSIQVKGQSALVEPLAVTIADTVPRLPFADAVTALDAALRGGDARPALTKDELQTQANRVKHSRARRYAWEKVLAFADPLAESAAESLSRVLIAQLGFAAPTLQTVLKVDGRTYRLDFEWEDAGVVGECDGWMKYHDGGRAELRREKVREDGIRSTGRTVVRWYWEDLQTPRRLRAKLLRAGVPQASA